MLIRILVVLLANLTFVYSFSQTSATVNIIPKPVSVKVKSGTFRLDSNTRIVVNDQGDRDAADFLNSYLQKFYGLSLNITDSGDASYISLTTKKFVKAPDNAEHYTLEGTAKNICDRR